PRRWAGRRGPARAVARRPLGAAACTARPRGERRAVGARLAQARAVAPPDRRDPVFVRGPGLGTGSEVPPLAAEDPHATEPQSGPATARRVLAALDGAGLAHIAAHGTFRADSPLFSSLRMDDGPLTVYDLERLRRAPYRAIFSSCDSGLLA